MSSELGKIFPIKEIPVEIAFTDFRFAELDPSTPLNELIEGIDLKARFFQDTFPDLFKFLIRHEDAVQNLMKEVASPSSTSLTQEITEAESRLNRYRSYMTGISVGYDALFFAYYQEFGEESGLPMITNVTATKWRTDTMQAITRDILSLGDIISGVELPEKISRLETLHRWNPMGSGYLRQFFNQETALANALNRYIVPQNTLGAIIQTPSFAKGLRDVCTIYRVHSES